MAKSRWTGMASKQFSESELCSYVNKPGEKFAGSMKKFLDVAGDHRFTVGEVFELMFAVDADLDRTVLMRKIESAR